jgi:hypothetical protein
MKFLDFRECAHRRSQAINFLKDAATPELPSSG